MSLRVSQQAMPAAPSRDRRLEGAAVFDAALEAARVRLRPIVMTTMCFIHMMPKKVPKKVTGTIV